MEYITTKEASSKWGISVTRITILANEGRIPGAQRLGRSWLIPSDATKPPKRKANRSGSSAEEIDTFSFPLYHFRPDWSDAKKAQLSGQQQTLLMAETAVLECRFADAWSALSSILNSPGDIITEIGCLWNAGICCIALNKPDDFSRIFLRLQLLLSADFPHRDDLLVILDTLKTYVQTIGSTANNPTCNIDAHYQSLPMICLQSGYVQLTREIMHPKTSDTTLLELNLRLLKSTGSVIAIEVLHCHLLCIYYLRHNVTLAGKHAEAVVQIAYDTRFCFPLVTYYHYFSPVLSPVLARYPKEFQEHCHEMITQYSKNYNDFISSISKHSIFTKITDEDFPYICSVLTNLTNTDTADKLGVSPRTVKRKLARVCEKMGVSNKKELKEYLHNYM